MVQFEIVRNLSPRWLLGFLHSAFLGDVPPAVWNQRLWMYRELIPALNEAMTGAPRGTVELSAARSENEIRGACISNLENHSLRIAAFHNCRETIRVGLSECACCTWTSDRDNLASRNLAGKFGMRMAHETIRYGTV